MRRQRRLWLWAALAVTGALPLSGCGHDTPPAPLPTGTSPAPTAPTTATAEPGPTASAGPGGAAVPQPAPQARQQTDTGAKAFGVYYIRLLDYTYATRDVAPLRAASDPGCAVCQGIADDVAKFARPGYRFQGGRITLKDLTISQPGADQPVIVANVSISALTVTNQNGRRDPYSEQGHPRAQFMISEQWTGTQWTVTDLKLGT